MQLVKLLSAVLLIATLHWGGTLKNFEGVVRSGFSQPFTMDNVTKLTTFDAILMETGKIWPESCHLLEKIWLH